MRSVDLAKIEKRSEAISALAEQIEDPALHSFFTQSLDLKNRRWKLNLDVLEQEMPKIIGFPKIDKQFEKATLFLYDLRQTIPCVAEHLTTEDLVMSTRHAFGAGNMEALA